MPMVRCDADKHFYNSDSNARCPYCSTVSPDLSDLGNWDRTEIVSSGVSDFHPSTESTQLVDSVAVSSTIATYKVNDGEPTLLAEQYLNRQENSNLPPKGVQSMKTRILGFGESVTTPAALQMMSNNSMSFNKLPVTGWLVIIDGPGAGLDFRLIQGENRIGREKEMEICLDFGDKSDEMVSRDSHAVVVYDNHANVFFVERGRSRNMPLLNDRTIRSGDDLQAGDIIQVGKTKLMLITFCNESFRWGQ